MKKSLFSAIVCWLIVTAQTASAQIDLSFSFVSPTCNGYTNGSATVTPAGGTAPYTFSWGNGQSGQTNIGIGAGVYTVTVMDANSQTTAGEVTVMEPAPVVATITGAGVSCDGNSGLLTAAALGGVQPFTYHWSTQATTQSIPVTGPNNYFVTVSDANDCADVATITIANPLAVDVVVTNIPCASAPLGGAVNAVISGGAAPYSILWNDNNTNASRQNLPAGTYSVTITDANNCTAVDQGTILIPPALSVVAVAITPSCGGANNGSATVVPSGGAPPYTHTWTPGGFTGSTATGLAPGQYYVCTFDANQCQVDLWVIIPEITSLDVSLSVLSAECTGVDDGVVTAFVNPPGNYEYEWNLPPFHGVNQLTGLAANTFVSVTVTDPVSGCTGTASTTVSAYNAISVAVTDTDIPCAGQNIGTASANATGGTPDYQYVWLTPPTGPQIGVGPNISGLAPGAYLVSVTDSRGCTAIGVADIGIISGPIAAIGGSNTVTCGATESVVQFVNLSTDPFGTIASWVWTVTTPNDTILFNNISPIQVTLPVGVVGTAQLVVTSANGCVAMVIDTFTVPGIPDISISTGPMAMDCKNGPVDLIVNGGNPSYTYVWSPLTGLTLDSIPPNAVANPSITTTYQLIASDQGCMDTVSVTVIRITPIELSVENEVIETCDSTVVLLATSSVSNVIWIDANGFVLGNNPVTVVAGATAIYTAIATDPLTGCVDSLDVSVTGLPNITLTTDAVMMDCDNLPVNIIVHGGGPSLTYVWSPTTGLTPGATPPNVIADPAVTTTYQLIASNEQGCNDTVSVTVIRVIPIELSVENEVIETCDSTVVLLATSNVSNVIWVDANGVVLGNNPVTVVAGATAIYTAIATDTLNGCVDSLAVSVTGLPNITLTTDAVMNDCDNLPVHITVHGGSPSLTYVWSPMTGLTPGTTPPDVIADPAVTTTYQLIASNDKGCNDTVSVTIIRVIPIELSVENEVIETCDSTVVLSATSNVSNVIWVDANGVVLGNNPVTVVAGATAIYTAIATDTLTGCVDSLDVSVTGLPNITLTTDAVMNDCDNLPVHITVHGGSPSLTYVWSPMTGLTPGTTPPDVIADPAVTTTYQLIASNDKGCNDTVSVTIIRVIPIELSVENEVIETCDSTVVLLATSNVSNVIWVDANGVVLGNNPVTVVAGSTAIYTAIATDTLTGCVDSLDVSVTGLPNITLTTDAVMSDCDNLPVHITVHGGSPSLTYVWSPMTGLTPGTTPPDVIADPAVTTTYQLIASNDKGCNDTVSVTIIRVIPIELSVENEVIETCDSTVLLLATSNVSNVIWIDANGIVLGNNPVTVVAGATAIYTAIATDPINGCIDSLDVSVTGLPAINLTAEPTLVDCNNAPVNLIINGGSPSYTYVWSPLTGLTPGLPAPNAVANPTETTTYQLIASSPQGCQDTVSITVVRVIPITLTVDQSVIESCDSTVLLTATSNVTNVIWVNAAGEPVGTPPTNPVLVNAGATTTYTAIATDAYGCADSTTVSVTGIGTNVNVDPNMPGVGCTGADIQLGLINNNPSDILQYQWTVTAPLVITGATTGTPIVSGPAGSYNVTVTVTNQYNCSETLIIPLQIDEMMSIEQAITADLCTGKIVKFFNNSGVPGLWNFGDTQTSPLDNPTHAYAEAGIYNVTFTPADNVCIMPWDSMINVQEVILEAPGIANNYVNCIDSAEIIFNGISNNPNVSWSWTFSNGNSSVLQNPVVTITEEGVITATLTVTDPNGCTTTSVLEDVPVMFIDDHILEQLSFCADTSIELNADGVDQTATYLWTSNPADADLITTDKNPTVSPAVETVYSVTISQGPLCTVTYQVTVTPKEGANLQLPPDMVVCNDNLVSITATGNGISYEWSTSLTFDPVLANTPTVTITPIKDGIYYVRTTNLAGCSALDSIKVNNGSVAIQPEPFDGDICAGEVTQLFVTNLDADDVLSFNWSPTLGNVPNPEVAPNQETTYHVVVTNQYGCSDELDFLVNVSIVSVVAEITGKDTICPGMSTTLLATASGSAAPFTFEWSPASGLSDATIPNPVAAPEQEQTYTVTVTNSNGCTSTDEVTIYFISGQCVQPYIFVPKAFTPNNDANNDFFIVRGVNITELVFIVWDRWGEKVYETTDPAAQGWDGTFNGKELTPDSYAWYLRATCGNGAVYESKGDVTLLK